MAESISDLCMKFPAVLRKKLLEEELSFPDNIKFDYEPILAYRAVRREEGEDREVTREDFASYYELYKDSFKKPRALPEDWECKIEFYAASLFKEKNALEMAMYLPKPKKRIIEGCVNKEGGPQETDSSKHINWWLYEDADLSNFSIKD